MNNLVKKIYLTLLLLSMPFLCGCLDSGGTDLSSSLFGAAEVAGVSSSNLFVSGGSAVSELALNSVTAVEVATITNPEPASMLLIGGGMVVMACLKGKKSFFK